MQHYTTPQFWQFYNALPRSVKELADKNFALLKTDPNHPSLNYKQIGQIWSVRVGLHYRALALERAEGFVWYWIGTHSEYDKLIR